MAQASSGRTVMVDGRIVWTVGRTVFEGKPKTDMQTRQPVMDKTTGQQVIEYGFGLAIPKSSLGQPAPYTGGPGIWQELHAEAMTMFPNGQIPPSFAMKFKDGDTAVDNQGRSYSTRPGHAGHIVLACTTRIPIKFFKNDGSGNQLVNEGIKCGDYVRVQVQIKAHPAQGLGKAGLYVNPNAVQFMAWGEEIINIPSGDDIFGNAPPPIPPGGSATPIAPAGAFPGMPAPTAAPAAFQPPPMPPAYQQPVQPPQAPAPHYGVVPPAFQPPPGGAPAAYPTPPMPGTAPAAVNNWPAANPAYPAPVPGAAPAMTPPPGMPGPTGYPPAAAPMGAYPGNGFPPPPR